MSPILTDVQRVCDTVGVLREGRLLYQGSIDELLVGRVTPAYVVRVRAPVEPALAALRPEPWVRSLEDAGHGEIRVGVGWVAEAEAGLVAALARSGARIISVSPRPTSC